MYLLPKMKEPVPRDMEHAEMQIEVCMHGFFMAGILPHFNSLKAFMVYFWHNVHRHKDHDAFARKAALEKRWMRLSTYQYEENALPWNGDEWRHPNTDELDVLLVFPRGFTAVPPCG